MSYESDTTIRRGSNNVFADLGYADPDTHLLKAQLVNRMHETIRARKLTQTEAARVVGVSQPDISRLLKGQFRDVSVDRIMRMLTRLGCTVDIIVTTQDSQAPSAPIHFHPITALGTAFSSQEVRPRGRVEVPPPSR